MARFHPSDEWLALYASGALEEHLEMLIASHLTYCPECRAAVARHEEIAGALFEAGAGDALDMDGSVDAILSGETATLPAKREDAPNGSLGRIAPRALTNYVFDLTGKTNLEDLNWADYSSGIRRAMLMGDSDEPIVRLVEAQPGAKFDIHTHKHEELTLVLQGAYRDATGLYGVGDVQTAKEGQSHQPIIEEGDVCFALIISDKSD